MKTRYTYGDVVVTVLQGWNELAEEHWLALGQPGHPFESKAWLLATVSPETRVLVAWIGEQPVAALPVEPARVDAPPLHTAEDIFVGSRAEAIMRNVSQDPAPLLAARTASWKRVAVVLSPFAYRHVLRGKRDSSAIVNALLNALEEWCDSENFIGIAFPYLWEHEDACPLSALRSRGTMVTLLGAGCGLPVTWQSPGDYFRWLGRRTIRRAFERTLSDEHRRTRLLRSGEPLDKKMRTDARHLMEWSAQRHGYRIPPGEFYEQLLAEWPDERFLAWIDNPEGPVESFALAFIYNNTVMPKFGCHRYKTGDYFNLCFTEMIVHAIEQKHAFVDFGASNHQAKLLRGGQIYWIAGAILTLDKSFTKTVIPGLDAYSSAILSYISELSSRYSVDHRVPPLPGWMGN